MFSPHVPAGIVGRQEGWNYVFPFTLLMFEWTESRWPFQGSFGKSKLQIAKMNVNPGMRL